ncbi:hypothetical protein [Mycolicibacterium peregrinum]
MTELQPDYGWENRFEILASLAPTITPTDDPGTPKVVDESHQADTETA